MADLHGVLAALGGGDRRSIGRSNRVVQQVLSDRRLMAEIMRGLRVDDAVVRMRCADIAEKVSRIQPGWLLSYQKTLLGLIRSATQQELRWHLAQMAPRLKLTARQRASVTNKLTVYLSDDSRIVRVCAMQALAEFAAKDPRLRRRVVPMLGAMKSRGAPSSRARAGQLLRWLAHQ